MHECVGGGDQIARIEAEYYELLERMEPLWDSAIGTLEDAELHALVERILQYEDFLLPIKPRPERPLPRPEDFPPDSGMTEKRIQLYGPAMDRAIDGFRAMRPKLVCWGIRVRVERRLAEAGVTTPTLEPVPRRKPEGD